MEYLMDRAARSVIHRHDPAPRIRETPLQRHFLAQTDIVWHAPEATHNPKVVGSIPTPATNKSPGQSTRSDLGFAVLGPVRVRGYRNLTYRDRAVPVHA